MRSQQLEQNFNGNVRRCTFCCCCGAHAYKQCYVYYVRILRKRNILCLIDASLYYYHVVFARRFPISSSFPFHSSYPGDERLRRLVTTTGLYSIRYHTIVGLHTRIRIRFGYSPTIESIVRHTIFRLTGQKLPCCIRMASGKIPGRTSASAASTLIWHFRTLDDSIFPIFCVFFHFLHRAIQHSVFTRVY